MSRTLVPNVTSGGIAMPIGRNMYYMRGKKHKDGGIVIGNKTNGLEVEDGEVVKLDNDGTKVYSSMPLLNGNSPAQLVLNGFQPNKVFNDQERYKNKVGLKDDGTRKYEAGGEDEGYTWKDGLYDAASFLPVVGSAIDIYEAVKDPSLANIANAAFSVGIDVVGGKMLWKGAKALYKGSKMIKGAYRAAKFTGNTVAKNLIKNGKAVNEAVNIGKQVFNRTLLQRTAEGRVLRNIGRDKLIAGMSMGVPTELGGRIYVQGNPGLKGIYPFGNNPNVKKYAGGGNHPYGRVSENGINLIRSFEGYMPRVYRDSGGVETIGYGETNKNFINKYRATGISRQDADAQLRNRAQWFYDGVARRTKGWDKLNQQQRDALTSYAYNIGLGGYGAHKHLLSAIERGDYENAALNINAGFNDARNPGLKKRRIKERNLFIQGAVGIKSNINPTEPPVVSNPEFDKLVTPNNPFIDKFMKIKTLYDMTNNLPKFRAGGKFSKIRNLDLGDLDIRRTRYTTRVDNTNVNKEVVERNNKGIVRTKQGTINRNTTSRAHVEKHVNGASYNIQKNFINGVARLVGHVVVPIVSQEAYTNPLNYEDYGDRIVLKSMDPGEYTLDNRVSYVKKEVPYNGKNRGDSVYYKNGKAYTTQYVPADDVSSFVGKNIYGYNLPSFKTKQEVIDYVNSNRNKAMADGKLTYTGNDGSVIDKIGNKAFVANERNLGKSVNGYARVLSKDEQIYNETALMNLIAPIKGGGALVRTEGALAKGTAVSFSEKQIVEDIMKEVRNGRYSYLFSNANVGKNTAAEGKAFIQYVNGLIKSANNKYGVSLRLLPEEMVKSGTKPVTDLIKLGVNSGAKNVAENGAKPLIRLGTKAEVNSGATSMVKPIADVANPKLKPITDLIRPGNNIVSEANRAAIAKRTMDDITNNKRAMAEIEEYVKRYNSTKHDIRISEEDVVDEIVQNTVNNSPRKGRFRALLDNVKNNKKKYISGALGAIATGVGVYNMNRNPDRTPHGTNYVEQVTSTKPAQNAQPVNPNNNINADTTRVDSTNNQTPQITETPDNQTDSKVVINNPNVSVTKEQPAKPSTTNNTASTPTTRTNTIQGGNTNHNTPASQPTQSNNSAIPNSNVTNTTPQNTPALQNNQSNGNTSANVNAPTGTNTTSTVNTPYNSAPAQQANDTNVGTPHSTGKLQTPSGVGTTPTSTNADVVKFNRASGNSSLFGNTGPIRVSGGTFAVGQRKGHYDSNGNPVFDTQNVNIDGKDAEAFVSYTKGSGDNKTIIPSKKFTMNYDSYRLPTVNELRTVGDDTLSVSRIANGIAMQNYLKENLYNGKAKDVYGKTIDANYKPETPSSSGKISLWDRFKALDDGTKSDIIGIGANSLASVAGFINNASMLNSLQEPIAPTPAYAAKLKTTVNVAPQLNTVDSGVNRMISDTNDNTASSNVAASRNIAARLTGMANKNQIYGNKENTETELINKDKLNQQEVHNANALQYNQYLNNLAAFRNNVADKRSENINGLINGLNSGVQDFLTKREQRTNFRNTIKASLVANPDAALLMGNAFKGLFPESFMQTLYNRQAEAEEMKRKELQKRLTAMDAIKGAADKLNVQ